jgi:isopenicillin-N N-acyltransferase-like protein
LTGRLGRRRPQPPIARYTSTEAGPGDRGRRFGSDHRDAVRRNVAAYERLFDEIHGLAPADLDRLGAELGARLRDEAPDLAVEIVAIAEGAEVSAARLVAVNARTEILAGAGRPECSVIGLGPACRPEAPLLAQNWDWHPAVADGLVIWTVVEPDGTWFTTLTEAGILAKVGLNSRGVAVCLNILASSADGGVSGLPIHLLLRRVLQRCGDMESAERLIGGHSYSASSALSVAAPAAGGETEIRTFEVSPRGVQTLADRDGILLHTNHFLDLPPGLEDRHRRDWPDTLGRLEELEGRFLGRCGEVGETEIKLALSSHEAGPMAICCHDADNPDFAARAQSLASILMHPTEGRMEVADGPPCTAPYRDVPLPQLAA